MKKVSAILTTVALLIALSTSVCFAEGLTVLETYPEEGSTGASIDNMGVKIYFDSVMTEDIVGEANEDAFQLYDDEGKKLPTRVLYNAREKGVVLVLLDNTSQESEDRVQIKGNTDYTLRISGEVVDDEGNTLGEDREIVFKTLNQSTNTLISFGMMAVMFGGMIIVSLRSAKKQAEEATRKREEKVNPYKEAKKTGKSVEEIVEKTEKKKAKEQKKKVTKIDADGNEYEEDEDQLNRYRVKARRPASEAGSKYVAAKKAASKKKAQAAKKKAQGAKKAKSKSGAKKKKK